MKYIDYYTDITESSIPVDKEYERREKFVNSYLEKLIQSCPGTTREEKLSYAWKHHHSKMEKLTKAIRHLSKISIFGLNAVNNYDAYVHSYQSKFKSDKYYIRFGDMPKSGKSYNFLHRHPEVGVSAYEVKWNNRVNKWEINQDNLNGEGIASLHELAYAVLYKSEDARPIYLIQGQELDDIGGDGEAMLDIKNVKIIKKLSIHEFFAKELGENWSEEEV